MVKEKTIKLCQACGEVLINNRYKLCDSCLKEEWENTEGIMKAALFASLKNRGIEVKYKKRCSCGSFLDNNNQKKCTDCLLDEMCELVKSGKEVYKIKRIYDLLRRRGYNNAEVDEIVAEELRN